MTLSPDPTEPAALPWEQPNTRERLGSLVVSECEAASAEEDTRVRVRVRSRSLSLSLSREEKRRRRRTSANYRSAHATRERVRVEAFNVAFGDLRRLLPILPPDKKLSKIEILKLAMCYISYLNHVLDA
ncbi:hypothetical protein NHX12_007260 [Muraenolepis orangiensis]|uniref:BHLH domain-containing protein n=1 Tax=Muraenolepis orangiensis TaxID=630683 RepID=A0A9Q0DPK2_9TELE|nr:hypothetical protein NHX12_007260 [Muraenolepis orangiensis]